MCGKRWKRNFLKIWIFQYGNFPIHPTRCRCFRNAPRVKIEIALSVQYLPTRAVHSEVWKALLVKKMDNARDETYDTTDGCEKLDMNNYYIYTAAEKKLKHVSSK